MCLHQLEYKLFVCFCEDVHWKIHGESSNKQLLIKVIHQNRILELVRHMRVENAILPIATVRKQLVHAPVLESVDDRQHKMSKGLRGHLGFLIQLPHAPLDQAKDDFNRVEEWAVGGEKQGNDAT